MRQLLLFILAFGMLTLPVWAQSGDTSVFVVTDVATDVTADSAAHARDKAIIDAQRLAFDQLLDRLGADKAWAAKLSDDDLATLVQNFEVQNERTSSVRYLGTFTVQFRPNAVRKLLGAKNAHYTETRSKPLLILPISQSKDRPVLWEEMTPWRAAWDKAASHNAGLVPLILPAGELNDISTLSTDEAASGKPAALQALIDKYHANGAVVAVLQGDMTNPASVFTVDVRRYDATGNAIDETHMPLQPGKSADDMIAQAVKQVQFELEKDWRKEARDQPKPDSAISTDPSVANLLGPLTQLPVLVPIQQLGDLAQIKQALATVNGVTRIDTISLARSAANIQLVFYGTVADLQSAMRQRNLDLSQDPLSGAWVLRPIVPASY